MDFMEGVKLRVLTRKDLEGIMEIDQRIFSFQN